MGTEVDLPAPSELPAAQAPDEGAGDDAEDGTQSDDLTQGDEGWGATPGPLEVDCEVDGCVQWRRTLGGPFSFAAYDGDQVVVETALPDADTPPTIRAPDDGRILAELEDGPVRGVAEIDDRLLLMQGPPEAGAVLVAYDPDGGLAWRAELETSRSGGCCGAIVEAGEGEFLVSAGGGAPWQLVQPATGQLRPSPLDPSDASEHVFQAGRDLVLRAYGESRVRILTGDGRRIVASGGWAHPLLDGDRRGVRDGRVLLLAEHELLAVDLPDAPS